MGARQRLGDAARGAMASAAMVLLSLGITLAVWDHLRDLEDAAVAQEFEQRAERIATRIEERLAAHAQILRGAAGLFDADAEVTRHDFHDYVAHLELDRYQPGLQALAFARVVKRDELAAQVAAIRAEGLADFSPTPPGDRPEYALLIFAEPDTPVNRRSLGFDLLGGASERAAALRAREDVAVSLMERLVPLRDSGGAPGALLMLPVHRHGGGFGTKAEERAATVGYVVLTFRFADMLAGIGGASNAPGIAFRAYDGSEADGMLVFDSDPAATAQAHYTAASDISFGGRTLHLSFRDRPDFAPPQEGRQSTLIASAGLVISALIGLLFSRLATASSRARQLAADMTVDLRDALERLGDSRERLRRFFDVAGEGLLFHEDGTIIDGNDAMARLFGFGSGAEIRGLDLFEFIAPAERAAVRERIAAGHPGVYETWLLGRGGVRRPVEVAAGSYEAAGHRIRVVSVRDITVQRAAADALRASEERIAAFIEFSPVAIVVAEGVEQRVVRINRKFKEVFGYDQGDLRDVGDWWARVIDDAGERARVAHAWREVVRRAIEEGRTVPPQRRAVLCRDGVHRWIDIYTAAHGTVTITTLIDVSERKRIEEELTLHRDHLQALVDERTRDLRAAKDVAERASQAKSDFLANMSHELRTPLHAILSFAHLGADRADGLPAEKVRDYFERVAAAGDRLLRLVDDLLDLSKLEAGRMEFQPEAVDLEALVGEVLAEFESLAVAKSLEVRAEPAACDTTARCDRGRIGQVLRNVLGNAIKFTPAGRAIRVVLDGAELPGGEPGSTVPALRIRVIDDGIGIPEGELEKVFDKFVQSSKTRSGAGGTGLGLAICRDIVAWHGGAIRAVNNPAGGATFEVALPRDGR